MTEPPFFTVADECYPTSEILEDFIQHYLAFNKDSELNEEDKEKIIEDEKLFASYQENLFSPESLKKSTYSLLWQIKIVNMCIQFFMTVWGILNARSKGYDGSSGGSAIDHLSCSQVTHDWYKKWKEIILTTSSKS